jgi:hypothetical protein
MQVRLGDDEIREALSAHIKNKLNIDVDPENILIEGAPETDKFNRRTVVNLTASTTVY